MISSSRPEKVHRQRDAFARCLRWMNLALLIRCRVFVEEDTAAIYVRKNFDATIFGIAGRGNIGLRGVNTDQVASGSEVLPDGTLRDVSYTQNYTNYLPSASLVLAPKEKIQIRFGYADIMQRPNFSDLSPTVQYPLNIGQAVNVGDPTLKPTKAKQFDATLSITFARHL